MIWARFQAGWGWAPVDAAAPVTVEAPRQAPRRADYGKTHKQPHKKLVAGAKLHCDNNAILYLNAKSIRVPAATRRGGFRFFSTSALGAPDFIVLEAGADGSHGLAIEFKCGRDYMKDAQLDWFERLKSRGYRCASTCQPDHHVRPHAHTRCCRAAGSLRSAMTSRSSSACWRSTSARSSSSECGPADGPADTPRIAGRTGGQCPPVYAPHVWMADGRCACTSCIGIRVWQAGIGYLGGNAAA